MKVRENITVDEWENGSGWSTKNDCYDDKIVEVDKLPASMDWGWWETEGEVHEETDTKITVKYYAENADPDTDLPLATFSTWENDLICERGQKEAQ